MGILCNNIFKTGFVLNDKWVIIEFIGKGAMGEVYRAHQLNLKRDVAIKVISREILHSFEDDPLETETLLHRFRREVQAMARVRHPNVLQIFDYGSALIPKDELDVPVEYIAMEYIPGATLRFTMSQEGFYPEQDLIVAWLSDYFLPLLEGVEAIHADNISHRDLKPENVLMDGKTPKIADFGLACSICMQPVTHSLDVKGTPAYMSPEHFFDFKNADQQSDIYSLGKILYEAVDGKITSKVLPFKGAALAKPDTPFLNKLDKIIQAATAEKKEERLKSVGDLRNSILEALSILKTESIAGTPAIPRPIHWFYKPRIIWSGIALAVLSMAAMGLWHVLGEPGRGITLLKKTETIQKKSPSPGSTGSSVEETATKTPEPSILGKDGITLRFIPGGELKTENIDPEYEGKIIRIPPFYMDEKMVTNHHFVDFLNDMKEHLVVENGIVKHNNKTWFYLGEGTASGDPIIFEHGRFLLPNTESASSPVVRVTWYGASSYARHFGKRLPTEYEWVYAVSKHLIPGKETFGKKGDPLRIATAKTPTARQMGTHMMHMDDTFGAEESRSATPKPPPTAGSDENLNVWVIRNHPSKENADRPEFKEDISYPSLVAATSLYSGQQFKNFRYPWEAFPDVGFRCVVSLGNED